MTIIDILKEKFLNKEIAITSGKSKVTGILTDLYSAGDSYHDAIEYVFNNDVHNYGGISCEDGSYESVEECHRSWN